MIDWFSFIVFVFVGSITPGPNNILALTQAGWVGFKHTFPFNCGVFFGMLGVSTLCTLLSIFMRDLVPIITQPLLYIGAAYILYLAYKTYSATGKIDDSNVKTKDGAPIGVGVGTLLQFVNPKAYVYALLCLEGYILPAYANNPIMLSMLCLFMAFSGFICTICWALFGSIFRVLFTKHAKTTNTTMALLLIYCAVSLFM